MKYNATFSKFFKGQGAVILNDMSLILIGQKEKLYIPIFAKFWQEALLVDTMRTIPYSIITQYIYKKNKYYHEIYYKLPSGKRRFVRFVLTDKVLPSSQSDASKNNSAVVESSIDLIDEIFKEKFKEKITLTKTFLGT